MTINETLSPYERPDKPESFDVQELDTFLDKESNLIVHSMHVDDESMYGDRFEETQAKIERLQKALEWRKDWQKPKVFRNKLIHTDKLNPVSIILFGDENGPSRQFPCLREWIESAPSAKALTPMYFPFETHLVGDATQEGDFNGAEIDENSHDFFLYGLDAIAIRTRARLLEMIAKKDLTSDAKEWISLACGGAIPVINTFDKNRDIHLDLVDVDPEALAFADKLAKRKNLEKDVDYSVHESDLESDLMYGDKLLRKFGKEKSDLIDMMGIFEYFRPQTASVLLEKAFELVKTNGTLVIANMLSNRPQSDFNERGIGWPGIFPRSLSEISEILEYSGIKPQSVDVYIPEDGIYAVLEIKK
jgi:hypothetical protein